jgi:hypothetical protein
MSKTLFLFIVVYRYREFNVFSCQFSMRNSEIPRCSNFSRDHIRNSIWIFNFADDSARRRYRKRDTFKQTKKNHAQHNKQNHVIGIIKGETSKQNSLLAYWGFQKTSLPSSKKIFKFFLHEDFEMKILANSWIWARCWLFLWTVHDCKSHFQPYYAWKSSSKYEILIKLAGRLVFWNPQ